MIMVNKFPTSQLNSTPAVLILAQLSRSLYFHLFTLVELDKFEQNHSIRNLNENDKTNLL